MTTKIKLDFDKLIDWICRILLSINIVLPGLNYEDETFYPLDVLLATLLALWLHFFNIRSLRLLAIVLLIFVLLINLMHWNMPAPRFYICQNSMASPNILVYF
jgi:hypothetical protein